MEPEVSREAGREDSSVSAGTVLPDRATNRRVGAAIGGAAIIIMLGNLSGSLLGFVRQAVILHVFGESPKTDAFFAASIVPQMFYDLTIGAAISAALIPTLSAILERRERDTFWRTFGSVLALAWIALTAIVLLLDLEAGPIMKGILWGFHSHVRPAAVDDAVSIARVLIPTLFFLGTSAVFLSTLYALRGFTVPALAPSFYHLGIIGSALALARPLGILALPVGALTGATCQALLQVPALVRAGVRWWIRPVFSTEVRQIIRLYVPIAAGLLVSIAGQIVDIDFKWQVGARAVTAMQTATMLTQFPIGIAVAAVSFAVLPAISADAASDRLDQFKDTLVTALRFVFFLTVPAGVGFLTLSTPIIAMLFQSGHFSGSDTSRTATALLGYSIQIPFVGIDQLLIFAFYARRNTVTPMIVGVIGVCVYVIAALLLMPRLHIFGLALANTLQNSIHACILLTLLLLSLGSLEGRGIGRTAATVTVTGLGMGAACLASRMFLSSALPSQHLAQRAATALLPLLIGSGVYLGGSALLRSRELRLVWSSAQRFRVRQ